MQRANVMTWFPTVCALTVGVALSLGEQMAAGAEAGRTFYITPDGAGSRDGSSWDSAATLAGLSTLIRHAGPGGTILIRADQGDYATANPIVLRDGGSRDRPVKVTGADASGRPMRARIVGTRSDPYTPGGKPGSPVFRLVSGANDIRFENLSFRNQGNGCFHIGADIRNLAIEHVDARNVRRFVENYRAGAAISASVDGMIIRNVEVNGFSKGAIRLQFDTRNVLIEDVVGDSERQDGDNFAEGVALEGTVHDVILRRVTMRNSHDTLHEYWNGDGFTTESGTYRIRFEDTTGSGNTDAGYDLKSSSTVLIGALSEDNKHNYKVWGRNVTISDCIGRAPYRRGGTGVQDHVEILEGADVTITDCQFLDSDPSTTIFHVERNARLRIRSTTVSKHGNAKMSLVEDGGTLILE
jgi:hypothetical protein